MRSRNPLCWALALLLFALEPAGAQTVSPQTNPQPESNAAASVPRVIRFSGNLQDLSGKAISGPVDVTFSLYASQSGGSPLWFETQTVQADALGNYTALLGAMNPAGVPIEIFTSGEAQWLGVQVANLPEQTRVLLVSVPYTMKAGDAETLGGKPASAYALSSQTDAAAASGAAATAGALSGSSISAGTRAAKSADTPVPQTIAQNYIPVFSDGGGNLTNSIMFQSGSNIGINTSTPTFGLDLNSNVFAIGPTTPRVGAGGTMRFRDDTGTVRWLFGIPGSAGSQDFQMYNYANGHAPLFIQNSAPSYSLYLNSNGNVGFGTSNPGFTVHVVRNDSTGTGLQARISNTSTATNSFAAFTATANNGNVTSLFASDGLGTGPAGSPGGYLGTYSLHPLSFVTNNTVRMKITSAGEVDLVNGLVVNGQIHAYGAGGTAIFGNGTPYGVYGTGPSGVYGFGSTYGVYGTHSTNSSVGELGTTASGQPAGVYGSSTYYGVYGSGGTYGVSGHNTANSSYGQLGTTANLSAAGVYGNSSFYGVYGDGTNTGVRGSGASNGVEGYNTSKSSLGELGTVVGGYGAGVSGTGNYGLYAVGNGVNNYGVYAVSIGNIGIYGTTDALEPAIFADGQLGASGDKTAIVALPDDRVVELYSEESPEVWFEDFGSGELHAGVAEVALDPTFALTVNTSDYEYHVFLTPDGDCEGLYVAQKTPNGFQVRELRSGKSNVAFEYRIVAKRRGFETVRLEEVETDAATTERIREKGRDVHGVHRKLTMPPLPSTLNSNLKQARAVQKGVTAERPLN